MAGVAAIEEYLTHISSFRLTWIRNPLEFGL